MTNVVAAATASVWFYFNRICLVERCWIAENTMIVQELVHKIKRYKGKRGHVLIMIDLRKAYDILEWSFIEHVLEALGFSATFRTLFLNYAHTVRHSLLQNGSTCGSICPRREIRQGDPMSSILFILWSKVLSRLLVKEEREDNLLVFNNFKCE